LSNFASIPLYDAPQDTFLIQHGPTRYLPDFGTGLIQRIYGYTVLDIFETLPTLINTEIAKIKNIKVKHADDSTIIVQAPNAKPLTVDQTDITTDQTDITTDQTYEI